MTSDYRSLIDDVKAVHRRFPTGVTIVTTAVEGAPFGLAVNAFSSLSLEPPTVLVCVNQSSATHAHLLEQPHIGINFLAVEQADVARRFAQSGGDKFSETDWHHGSFGVPLLDAAAAHLELEVEQRLTAHTHTIFVGRVLAAETFERDPLLYVGGTLFDGGALAAL